MNKLRTAAGALLLAASASAAAQSPWLHIYYPKGSQYQVFDMTQVLDITFDEEAGLMTVNTHDGSLEGKNESMDIPMSSISSFEIGANVPALHISTNEYVSEVYSKEIYLDGTLRFEGRGLADDFESPMKIRGRGNSTWGYSKKPYRIKFEEKTRMLMPKKAKNYVLLANYIDPSMMRNFVAFKFGEIIGMPWINHTYPVDVYFNTIYKGSYMLTEKVGFNNGSVDLSKEDEPNSIMFELDSYTNVTEEDHPFNSDYFDSLNGYYLPVRVKDPDAPTDPDEMAEWEDKWQDDFNNFMAIIDKGNLDAIFEACDLESLVLYVMVNNIACNQELDHPKSVYLYKTEGGKYQFGPCWDFDWAFGYQPTYSKQGSGNEGGGRPGGGNWWQQQSYPSYENPLLGHGKSDGHGGAFFYALCGNDRFKQRFNEVWNDFYQNHRDEFWAAFESYAAQLRPSANLQGTTRSSYQDFDTHVKDLRDWVENRIEYINSDPNHALWEDSMFR